MYFLVTAGPTREHIDAVRFLSNPSSGVMGYAVAEAAKQRGHEVCLVSGPTHLSPPKNVEFTTVTSAQEMLEAVLRAHGKCDCLVMTAAVGDYTPAHPVQGKIKKKPGNMNLELKRTTDILAATADAGAGKVRVGFALEIEDALENARGKLKSKKLDFIVLNGPASFQSEQTTATIIDADGSARDFEQTSKQVLAEAIVEKAERSFAHKRGGNNE